MKNGFYLELESLQKETADIDFGFLENTSINIGSKKPLNMFDFLHGYCDEFAIHLSKIFDYTIEFVKDDLGNLIHAYCISYINNEKAYIDVRGITTDSKLFYEEFCNEITYDNGILYSDFGEAYIGQTKSLNKFFDKKYSLDKNILQFILDYHEYYEIKNVR